MITDILTYIDSYDEIRAITGLNQKELPDTTLALASFRDSLGLELAAVSGIYEGSPDEETLQEIFDRLATTDPMFSAIRLFSIYAVADKVMESVGLRAYRTIADGKATLTRFSPESTYRDTKGSILDGLDKSRRKIAELLGITVSEVEFLTVVEPDIDLVTGA